MKVAIINFSGNVGKTTVAKQLLAPRMQNAPEFVVETINAGASDETTDVERMKGKEFGNLQEELLQLDSAIVDIGASNVEEFIRLMKQFDGSHEDFDFFVVPTTDEKKQQADTVNTIKTLAELGVPKKKIRVLFNKVELDDGGDLAGRFAVIFGFHDAQKKFTLNPAAVIYKNEVFERVRSLKKSIAEIAADQEDYRAKMRETKDESEKSYCVSMISAQRLAKSAHKNLDDVFSAVFK